MRNEILSIYYNKQSEDVLYPPRRWNEFEVDIIALDELIRSNGEIVQIYQKVEEVDFLFGKIPEVLPNYGEEDD